MYKSIRIHHGRRMLWLVSLVFLIGAGVILVKFGSVNLGEWKEQGRQRFGELFVSVIDIVRPQDVTPTPAPAILLRIGVLADSHGSATNMKLAVDQMRVDEVQVILHLGDFTAGGEQEYFADAKRILDESGLPYYVLPGDHDFNWYPEHSRENYEQNFPDSYNRSFVLGGVGFLMLDNSINSVDAADGVLWLSIAISNLDRVQTVLFFSPKPLYNPYFASKIDPLGSEIIDLLAKNGIKYAFAGDTHVFAQYPDLTDRINLVTVGAVGEYKNPLPQWVLVNVYVDGTLRVFPKPIVNFSN